MQTGGGAALLDPSKYADHGVQLEFLEQELRPYPFVVVGTRTTSVPISY